MSNNSSSDNFQRNLNGRSVNRLTISEQLDLIYSENNDLKSYINEQDYQREKLIKSFEKKICSLEYEKNTIIQDNNANYKLFDQQISNLNHEIFELKKLLNDSYTEKETYKEDYHKLEERYRVANEYIKVLPTPQESDRINNNLFNLKRSNERYRSQLYETQNSIKQLENELSRKNADLANSIDRTVIMKSQMDVLSEKLCNIRFNGEVKEECTDNWSSTPDLIEDMKLVIERYKTELVNYKQIIDAEKKKSEQMTLNYQKQMDDLQKQLESESDTVATLRRDIDQKQYLCSDLEHKLKSAEYQKQDILGNMMDLQTEIDRLDNFGSDALQRLFEKLLSEVILCVEDVETVSQCLWKLANKKELDVSELLGSASIETLSLSETKSILMDKPFLEQHLSNVKQSRARMAHIRDSITKFYTNQVASDLKFCITQ